jgi:hypothetical protein
VLDGNCLPQKCKNVGLCSGSYLSRMGGRYVHTSALFSSFHYSEQSLATGRLATFALPFVDCELPYDPDETLTEDGHVQPSCKWISFLSRSSIQDSFLAHQSHSGKLVLVQNAFLLLYRARSLLVHPSIPLYSTWIEGSVTWSCQNMPKVRYQNVLDWHRRCPISCLTTIVGSVE